MENKFIDSLASAQSILEYAIEGILVVEIETRIIRYANQATCKLFGYSSIEFIGLSMADIHPAEHLQKVIEQFEAIARGENELAREIPCSRKDGTIFLADISSSRIIINGTACNVAFFTDVTKRKQYDAAIHQSEKQFRSLFMSMSDGFYLSEIIFDSNGNPCDYRYLEVNPTFEKILGLGRDQIVGRRYKEIVPVDTTRWLDVYCTVARTGKPMSYEFYSAEYQMYFETYSYQPAEGQISVIVRNVTDRKRIEEALRNTQKLESLGVMAGGIAHDFNNLLAGIFGYIDLARSVSKDSRAIKYLDATLGTIDRAKALTRQLLTFARGGAPVQNISQLDSLIKETTQFALSGSNIACNFTFANDLRSCNIDKDQIAQVIDNIVINAQQAMPDGGSIEITAVNISVGENEHPLIGKGDYVKVSIKDSGIGIPKEIMPRIFDPFYTTKTKGHGLGLATCYSIIKRHGGCIEAESGPGKGSTFHFFLPASSKTGMSNAKIDSIHKGSGTIIVMDDEEVLRDTFRNILETFGYSVVCKNDGKEAVAYYLSQIRANHEFVAMIFDLTVPGGMGGMEAVTELRKFDKEIPIFVSSGYADNSVMENPAEHGFTASITKPFTIAELSEMLNKYLKK